MNDRTKETASEPRRTAPFSCGYCGRKYYLPRPRACCSRGREFDIKVIAEQQGAHVNDTDRTSKTDVEKAFNRAVEQLGALFAGKQSIREVAPQTLGCERYRLIFSGQRFSDVNVAMHDLGVALRAMRQDETTELEKYRTWHVNGRSNVEYDGEVVRICQGQHEKYEPCNWVEYRRSPEEPAGVRIAPEKPIIDGHPIGCMCHDCHYYRKHPQCKPVKASERCDDYPNCMTCGPDIASATPSAFGELPGETDLSHLDAGVAEDGPQKAGCALCAEGMNSFADPATGNRMHARNGVVTVCTAQNGPEATKVTK